MKCVRDTDFALSALPQWGGVQIVANRPAVRNVFIRGEDAVGGVR